MNSATADCLIEINHRFYAERGRDFSETRARLQAGVRRILWSLKGDETLLHLGLTPRPPSPEVVLADRTRPPVETRDPVDQTHPPLGRPDDSLRTAAPGASDFEGQAQIEHLLMEGEVRMTVADYANAVKVYEKLVHLAPRVAAFHLRLAVAMACYPRTSKLAEREFYEAARLEPDNAEIHYQWGLYYKVMKIKSRAVAEMRTAVRISPKHKAARAELESLSPKDSALTSLKKLFR